MEISSFIKAVSNHIGIEWKQLARALKFTETDVQAIAHDNLQNLKEQIYQLFRQWKMREGKNAIAEALLSGLVEAKLDEILKQLQAEGLIQSTGTDLYNNTLW